MRKKHGRHGDGWFFRGKRLQLLDRIIFSHTAKQIGIGTKVARKFLPFVFAIIAAVVGIFYSSTNRLLPDNVAPTVTLVGPSFIQHPVDVDFNDPGYTCQDNEKFECTMIVTGDTVDVTTLGEYVIKYQAQDVFGNISEPITRTIEITDAPIFSGALNGGKYNNDVSLTVSAGDITISHNGGADTPYSPGSVLSAEGTYVATAVSPLAGNKTTSITFYIDKTAPILTVNSGINTDISLGEIGIDLKDYFIASDGLDGSITLANSNISTNINFDKLGSYNLTATVGDTAGNYSSKTITINVVEVGTTPESCFTRSGSSITGYNPGGAGCGNEPKIPSKIGGTTITSIGASAFEGLGITFVRLNNYITTINESAFKDNNINTVVIGQRVVTIKASAFENNNLASLLIPNNVVTIENNAFKNNSNLSSLTFGKNLKTVGDSAFEGCNLSSLYITSAITSIGTNAFSGNSITTVSLEGDDKMRFNSVWVSIGFSGAAKPVN